MEQTSSEEQIQKPPVIQSPSTHNPHSRGGSLGCRILISLSAAALFASFFLPWAIFFWGQLSGLDIQKNFSSYKLVWLLPAGALLTVILSATGLPMGVLRRVAGAIPFAILIYSLARFGSDFWQMIAWGGWLALAAGAVLVIVPNIPKPQPKV